MNDRKVQANIKFKRVNEKEVVSENIANKYFLKNHLIVLDHSDFKEASPEKKITVLHAFVHLNKIDSIYFDDPYSLEP